MSSRHIKYNAIPPHLVRFYFCCLCLPKSSKHPEQRFTSSWHPASATSQCVMRARIIPVQHPNGQDEYCFSERSTYGKEITNTFCQATGTSYRTCFYRSSQSLTCSNMPASGSLWTSAASLARLHNQTVNIYPHLIGAVVFIAYPLQLYRDSQDTSRCVEWEDFLVVSVYCYCVAICLTLSSMCVRSLRCCIRHADPPPGSTFCVTTESRSPSSAIGSTTSAFWS